MADVGRLLAGDRVIHYSEGSITAISTVMTDGRSDVRPYGGTGDFQGRISDVYLARCSYETLTSYIDLREIEGRVPDVGPFDKTGG